jgi:tRNA dimethylallyltransferase
LALHMKETMTNQASGSPVIVLLGPTACGKTEVAIDLAQRFAGEIISADSRQVYRYMDIGTAKPTAEQRALVPHHLIDVVDPDQDYNVAMFHAEQREATEAILARGKVPFLVGGSGLYLAAAMGELQLPLVGPDGDFRAAMQKEAEEAGPEALHRRLAQVDPVAAARLHPNDLLRVIRALEVHHLTGLPLSAFPRTPKDERAASFRFLRIGLTAPRDVLYERRNRRVDRMMELGLLDEVKGLLASGYHLGLKSMNSLGYRELGAYLEGRVSLDEAVETFKRSTRRFAKRQMTWFRKTPDVRWFDVTVSSFMQQITRNMDSSVPGSC